MSEIRYLLISNQLVTELHVVLVGAEEFSADCVDVFDLNKLIDARNQNRRAPRYIHFEFRYPRV